MNIKKIKESTDKLVIMFDLYDRTANSLASDHMQKKTSEYKLNYLKRNLLRGILDSKKLCEKELRQIKHSNG